MQKRSKKISLLVDENQTGIRLDKYLSSHEDVGTRSRAGILIEEGWVTVNSSKAKPSYLVKENDSIEIEIHISSSSEIRPLEIPLEILFEDQDIIVVNKPAGLVVHPAAGHQQDTLVNALVAHTQDLSMKFGENRPGIVHRLDKDTSGIMVIAKNDRAHENLANQFHVRSIHRRYQAVVHGHFKESRGSIKSWLARHPSDRKRFASVRDRHGKIIRDDMASVSIGKWAATDFEVLQSQIQNLSFVQLKLHTGRTHQIRAHLSEMGHPIIGDNLYGAAKKNSNIQDVKTRELVKGIPRFALHAVELGFEHPSKGERLMFQVPWPVDLRGVLNQLGFCED